MFPSAERDGGNVVMIQHNIDNQDNVNTVSSTPISTRPGLSWNTNFPLPLGLFEEAPSFSEGNGKYKRFQVKIYTEFLILRTFSFV